MYKSHSYAIFSITFSIHFPKAITSKLQITFTKFCIAGHSRSQYLRTHTDRKNYTYPATAYFYWQQKPLRFCHV